MGNKSMIAVGVLLLLVRSAPAEDFDAVIDDDTRQWTTINKAADKMVCSRLWLDSKSKVVNRTNADLQVNKDSKIARGMLDEKTKKWVAGDAIEGGIGADIFKAKGKMVRVQVSVADDNITIKQLLVTKVNEDLELADTEFEGILLRFGSSNNGSCLVTYTRLEKDEAGKVINKFPNMIHRMTKETKYAWGKYNEKEKTWEVGEEITDPLSGAAFKLDGVKTVYVYMTLRDDRKGIAQVLITQIGEKGKKK